MKKYVLVLAVFFLVFLLSKMPVRAASLCSQLNGMALFSNEDDPKFLGYLSTDRFEDESILNSFGDYGSRFSDTSILNRFSDYGSQFSDLSPWNRFTSEPPRIVDADFNVIGHLTRNRFVENPVHPLAALLCFLDADDDRLEPFIEISKDDELFNSLISSSDDNVGAGPFIDVPWGIEGDVIIQRLKELGIIAGYPDGSFKPNATLNRAELLKIVMKARNGYEVSPSSKKCFSDVPVSAWYTNYVCYAKEKGIVKGYEDGTFRPEQNILYAEALKIALRAYDHEIKEGNPWYDAYIEYIPNKLGSSAGYFLPKDLGPLNQLSRKNMAMVIFEVMLHSKETWWWESE